jgi:hypothetical protein
MDSLLSFNYKSVKLEGGLVSADIMPETDEVLSLNPDNSLGFTSHFTPDTGLHVYKGKGIFYNEITLDSRGLTGKGTLLYLSSASVSDDIVFYPDSAAFTAGSFALEERTTGTVSEVSPPVTPKPGTLMPMKCQFRVPAILFLCSGTGSLGATCGSG